MTLNDLIRMASFAKFVSKAGNAIKKGIAIVKGAEFIPNEAIKNEYHQALNLVDDINDWNDIIMNTPGGENDS